jgi:hypothetical protein
MTYFFIYCIKVELYFYFRQSNSIDRVIILRYICMSRNLNSKNTLFIHFKKLILAFIKEKTNFSY